MRISPQDVINIIKVLELFIKNNSAELYLFGSRANDNLKGGDIDLLLLLNDQNLVKDLSMQKHQILAQIKGLIGDQRIDFKIANHDAVNNDPFLQIIFPNAILLHKW
jgi:predicted nucleotidyltransferase